MAQQYKTPGVYVEEKSLLPPSVAGVATAVPAFIGYTQKMPVNPVQKVTSLIEYESIFGTGKEFSFEGGKLLGQEFALYDSVRLYFDNGGGVCFIVSLGTYPTDPSSVTAAKYKTALNEVAQLPEVTLIAFPDAATLLGASALKDVQDAALQQCSDLVGRFTILDVQMATYDDTMTPTQKIEADMVEFRKISLKNLCYGAAYYPYLKTSYAKDIPFKIVVKALGGKVDDDAETGADDTDKALKNAAAIAKMDPDETATKVKIKAAIAELDETNNRYTAKLAELKEIASVIPPSGAVAGIYVSIDSKVGVWQAPANVGVSGAKDLAIQVNDNQQANMNVDTDGKSVNAIRYFKGKGILVWGGRTLDGSSNEWRFVPVRRLFSYVEQSVKLATNWVVFQPNDSNTWIKVKCQISNFLSSLWRSGALAGASPDEAFFVQVGKDITMTEADINEGYLRVRIGLAAVRPAEFIVLEFMHKVQE
ncbi:MAG: phage tail sheath family protein [Bacteroidales bacterium]|nr:phage tail sheath family protein [Bacteroidales bacterium]